MLNLTQGAMRERIDADEVAILKETGTLVVDPRRRRPRYFDGRFLAARDLTREQTYFLTRQADLGRAGGAGVVHGLNVVRDENATSIQVTAGHGVTSSGEIVVLPSSVVLDLTDVPEMQQLDAAFGLDPIPRTPARNRSGLFAVVLRPVEFTANPIASYPTSITEERSIEDGDIVEAVAITLVPYGDSGTRSELEMRRSYLAHEVFISGGSRKTLPAGVLPLAVIALDRTVVQWVDSFIVRREVGAAHGDVLGLGFSPRAQREAYLLQYNNHLNEILLEREASGRGQRFAASEHFLALPPAGRMPRAAIHDKDFTQIFFPPEIDVELSLVPEDELASLLEESLLLPPIDLTLTGNEFESTSIQVLVPVPRRSLRRLRVTLKSFKRALRAPVPGVVSRRQPIASLQFLKYPKSPPLLKKPESIVDVEWRKVLTSRDMLWYSRHRNLAYKDEIAGVKVRLQRDEMRVEKELVGRLKDHQLYTRFTNLKRRGSAAADAEMVALLATSKFGSKILMEDAIHSFESLKKVDLASTLRVTERFDETHFGEGINRLEETEPGLKTRITSKMLVLSGVIPEIDRLARKVPEKELASLTKDLKNLARTGDRNKRPKKIAKYVDERLRELKT